MKKLLLLSLLLFPALAFAQFLTPPLVTLTPTSATVTFTTCAPSVGTIDYGPTTSYGSTLSDMAATATHTFMLSGLLPSTTYYYKLVATDASGNIVTSGAGSGGMFKTAGAAPAATVSLTPPSLTFANATLNTATAVQYVTIAASGAAPITITKGFSFTGTEFKFGGAGTCKINQVLFTGQSCTAGVVFTPVVTGTHSGTLVINNNATVNPQIVPLTGTVAGVTPPPAHRTVLTWTPSISVGVMNTLVFRNNALLTTLAANATTYTDTSVGAGQTYTYDVEAQAPAGLVSPPSNVVTITVPTP